MIYLYGLFDGASSDLETALSDLSGLQGALEIVSVGPWYLVFSEHEDEEILPKRRHMLAHTQVLEAMISAGTILPARFGLMAEVPSRAVELITAQRRLVEAEFERVKGHVELGVRISFERSVALEATLHQEPALRRERDALVAKGPEAHFAIAEFGGRLADTLDRRRGVAQRVLLERLLPLVSDHVLRAPEEDTEVLRAEFLVKSRDQDRLISETETAAKTLDFAPDAEPVIKIIGPVPMYNFVRLNLAFEPDGVAA